MRYIKQPNDYGCGPTAIINALKFQGHKVTLKDFRKFKTKLNCLNIKEAGSFDGAGTTDFNLSKVAKQYGFKRLTKPTLPRVMDVLHRGDAVLICSRYRDLIGETTHHVFIATAARDKTIYCVNNEEWGKPHHWSMLKTFQRYLRKNKNGPHVWIVPK